MTTKVTINAHLSTEKEVRVIIKDNADNEIIEEFALQDGESAERLVYDGREINIMEVVK